VAAVVFDALAVPGGADSIAALRATPGVFGFLTDFHRHLKPVWIANGAQALYKDANLPTKGVAGVTVGAKAKADVASFVKSAARRYFDRDLPGGLRT
jgi:catalase